MEINKGKKLNLNRNNRYKNRKLNLFENKIIEKILNFLTIFSLILSFSFLLLLIGYILVKGIPNLKLSLFSLEYNTSNVSMLPAIISTVIIVLITLIISVPLSVGAAIYLTEYANSSGRLVKLIRLTTETLSGIPSIVYGLFGMLFFSNYLKLGNSILSGSLTLAIMVLPTLIRNTEEAILSVPIEYREGAYALGDNKLGVIFRIVLPAAKSGIVTGIILGIGRIIGETAALIYTAGTVAQIPSSIFDSARTLSIHMYALSSEGLYAKEAYATATVLLLLSLSLNLIASKIED